MKQNKLQQIWLVTCWEFMHFFKWKQELISKLILVALAIVVFAWQYIKGDHLEVYQVAVTSKQIQLTDTNRFKYRFVDTEQQTVESLLRAEQEPYDAVLTLTEQQGPQQHLALSVLDKQSWHPELIADLNSQYRLITAKQFNLKENQLALLEAPIALSQTYLDESIKSEDEKSDMIAIVMIALMAVGIFTSFGQLFVSITGEKQQRVTEQLYSCISAQTWIDGKIFGQLFHAIKAMITAGLTGLLGFAFMAVVIEGGSVDLSLIDWSFIPWLLIFSVLGIYISTAFIAAIAAGIDDPNHSAKTSLMMLPLLPVLLAFITMDDASGWAMSFLSYFPITSFVAMPVKMSVIDVPIWQPLIALVLSLALAAWLRTSAARMFKMGMTMYGKEPSVGTMFKWMLFEPKQ